MTPDKRETALLKPNLKKTNSPGGIYATRKTSTIRLSIALSIVLFLFTACVLNTPSQTPVSNRPDTKIFDFQSAVVMKSLVRVLTDKKFTVNAERTNQQSLETEWLEEGPYRSMVQAEVLPLEKYRSQLTVTLLLQKKAFLQESWQSTDKIDKTVYKDFMNDVLIECYRVLYDRRWTRCLCWAGVPCYPADSYRHDKQGLPVCFPLKKNLIPAIVLRISTVIHREPSEFLNKRRNACWNLIRQDIANSCRRS